MTETYDSEFRVVRPGQDELRYPTIDKAIRSLKDFKGPCIIFAPDGTRLMSRGSPD